MQQQYSLGDLIRKQMDDCTRQERAILKAKALMRATDGAAVVYDFFKAPEEFRVFSQNGGDEDYLIIHMGETGAMWYGTLRIESDDTYLIGANIYVTITAHA